MSDPRNVAHDKKVTQEKQHKKTEAAPKAKRAARDKKVTADEKEKPVQSDQPEEAPKIEQGPTDHEKAVTILSKLKEMEFHSRANIEALAQLTLTIEEELKQGEFSEAIGSVYSAQDAFHSKIATLIESYAAKCEEMKGTA